MEAITSFENNDVEKSPTRCVVGYRFQVLLPSGVNGKGENKIFNMF